MRVQQRVEFAGTGVNELSRNQIASDTVALVALFADSGGREGFQFAQRNARRLLVRRDQPSVVQCHCQNRNRFRSRTSEIKVYPALVFFLLSLRQPFVSFGISVFTQGIKLFARNVLPGAQSQ